MEAQTKQRLIAAISSVFDRFNPDQFSEELMLGDIPDWDSMNGINLQMAVESEFSVELKDASLAGTDRVADILRLLRGQGVAV